MKIERGRENEREGEIKKREGERKIRWKKRIIERGRERDREAQSRDSISARVAAAVPLEGSAPPHLGLMESAERTTGGWNNDGKPSDRHIRWHGARLKVIHSARQKC